MGPYFKSYKSYKFDWPGTIRDQTKMNLAGHCVRRLSGNYFEPWFSCSSLPTTGLIVNILSQ